MSLSRLVLSTTILTWFCLFSAESALAQEESALDEARSRFTRGLELYESGDFEAALADFTRAYEIAPHFAVLYNIAQVRAQLRLYPDAVQTFERYLAEGGGDIPAPRRAEVQEELGRLGALIGRIELTVDTPAQATVYVDGTEVGRAPLDAPLPVAAGRHVIEVRGQGHLPTRRLVTIAGGEVEVLRISLDPESGAPGAIQVVVAVPGATISLDGSEVGTTPLAAALSVNEGSYRVEVSRTGYQSASVEVVVDPAEVERVELRLTPLSDLPSDLAGVVAVEPSEPDAEILLDGQPLAEGPVPIGAHILEVRLAGFESWSREIEVAPGAPLQLSAELRPTEDYLERYRSRVRSWWIGAWLVTSISAVVLGTALAFFIWNSGRNDDWNETSIYLEHQQELLDSCPGRPDCSELELAQGEIVERADRNSELGDELEIWSGIEWATLGLGLAGVGVALYLFLGGPERHRYADVAISPTPSGVTVSVSGALPW